MWSELVVAKVGGSLYDWPTLRERLDLWVQSQSGARVVLFPGGGATADVVRLFDRVHGLGEEVSHWLALRTLSVNARMLAHFFPEAPFVADSRQSVSGPISILDPFPFFEHDEAHPGHLPHCWEVTSDSLAVRAGQQLQANRVVLLKSTSLLPGGKMVDLVDPYFERAISQCGDGMPIEMVNLRASPSPT